MKCFKISLILFSLFSFSVLADQDVVVPATESNIINNGEIYQVKIVSEKSDQELEEFENQKINDIMWVISFESKGDGRYFEVFVTDPPKPKKVKPGEELERPAFGVSGFKYEYLRKNTQGAIEVFDIDYVQKRKLDLKSILLILFVIIIVLLIGLIYLKKTERSRKLKAIKKAKAKKLKEAFIVAKTREEFEELYEERRYFVDLFQESEELRDFFTTINQVQYKKIWSQEDLKEILKKRNNFPDLRRRSGV